MRTQRTIGKTGDKITRLKNRRKNVSPRRRGDTPGKSNNRNYQGRKKRNRDADYIGWFAPTGNRKYSEARRNVSGYYG